MEQFKPTWLYIKQHNQTGLKYFGMTTKKNPITYKGSGKYWRSHLRLHGADITTLWCQLFTNRDELVKYAIDFSVNNNIVESPVWANLIIEDCSGAGRGGHNKGRPMSIEQRKKISEKRIGGEPWNKGKSCPSSAENGRKGAAKMSKTVTGRKRKYHEDGSWTWTRDDGKNDSSHQNQFGNKDGQSPG